MTLQLLRYLNMFIGPAKEMGRGFPGKNCTSPTDLCLNFRNWILQTCCLLILRSVISEALQKITVSHVLFRSLQWVTLAIPQQVDIHQQPQVSCLDEVNVKWQWWSRKVARTKNRTTGGFSWLTEAFCALLISPVLCWLGIVIYIIWVLYHVLI